MSIEVWNGGAKRKEFEVLFSGVNSAKYALILEFSFFSVQKKGEKVSSKPTRDTSSGTYFRTFEKVLNLIPYENFFRFEALEFQCNFLLRPSKVRKLVRTNPNQFQLKSTKMGTGRKFVTLL